MITAVAFGTLPGWLTLGAIAFLAYFLRGVAGGQAVDILREQRDILAARVTELEATNSDLTKRITELEARTDVSLAIGPALVPVVAALQSHEVNAEHRTQATLDVLHMIAGSLGPDPEKERTP